MSQREPSFWQQSGRKILWGIALGLLIISIVVTLFTPVTFLLIFLPFIFTPFLWPRRREGDGEDDEDDAAYR